jgi:hypothetical protein
MLSKKQKSAYTLAMVNVGIWAIAMIAMVFLMQDYPGAKGLFPILGGGIAVGISLISAISGLE